MDKLNKREFQICTNCVMDTTDSKIVFDEKGVCDYCNSYYNDILPHWTPGTSREDDLMKIAEAIRAEGKGKKYDCIIGMSGGMDSSYLTYLAVDKMKLRPLIFTVDTGWNLDVADENTKKIVEALKLDMVTELVDWEEMKDLQLAFFKAQVPYQDLPQDHAIFAALYNYAVKHDIKYVLTGSNISTESVRPPIEWVHLNDLKLIKDIHAKYGKKPLKTFPTCSMFKYRLYYAHVKGMKRVAPLDYIDYDKEKVQKELFEKFGWKKYENKHYENILTRFYEGYYLPHKFGFDKRKSYFSNLILTNQMTRDEALKLLEEPGYDKATMESDLRYIAQKLGVSEQEFKDIIGGENKIYKDYRNSLSLLQTSIKLARLFGVEKRNFR